MKPSKILLSSVLTGILSTANISHASHALEVVSSTHFSAAKEAGKINQNAMVTKRSEVNSHVAVSSHVAVKSSGMAIKNQTPIKVEIIEENGKHHLVRGESLIK